MLDFAAILVWVGLGSCGFVVAAGLLSHLEDEAAARVGSRLESAGMRSRGLREVLSLGIVLGTYTGVFGRWIAVGMILLIATGVAEGSLLLWTLGFTITSFVHGFAMGFLAHEIWRQPSELSIVATARRIRHKLEAEAKLDTGWSNTLAIAVALHVHMISAVSWIALFAAVGCMLDLLGGNALGWSVAMLFLVFVHSRLKLRFAAEIWPHPNAEADC